MLTRIILLTRKNDVVDARLNLEEVEKMKVFQKKARLRSTEIFLASKVKHFSYVRNIHVL